MKKIALLLLELLLVPAIALKTGNYYVFLLWLIPIYVEGFDFSIKLGKKPKEEDTEQA